MNLYLVQSAVLTMTTVSEGPVIPAAAILSSAARVAAPSGEGNTPLERAIVYAASIIALSGTETAAPPVSRSDRYHRNFDQR